MPRSRSGNYLLAMVATLAMGLLSIPAIGVLHKTDESGPANELRYVQSAVTIMMTHNQIASIPHPVTVPTNDMTQFPDATTSPALNGLSKDDKPGYVLYQHDNRADDVPEGTVDYLRFSTTKWYYTVEADGTVIQWEKPSTIER